MIRLSMLDEPNRYEGPVTAEALREQRRVAAGQLPPRYADPWGREFFTAVRAALKPQADILDIGSGRRPALPASERPPHCNYVGLDVSRTELLAAGEDAYDEIVVADITKKRPDLEGCFDLALSWQVLEHVESMAAALENTRAYLRPNGSFVAQMSGSFAAFSLLARVIPHSVSKRLMGHLLETEEEEKFPTRYDRCYASALEQLLAGWSQHQIVPRFKGGSYFAFARPIERAYLAYENWTERGDHRNLATHYVIRAIK